MIQINCTVRTLNPGHLRDCISYITKDSQVFCKRTSNIHKFEGCFLRGPVGSKGFIVFNGCIVEYLNFLGP